MKKSFYLVTLMLLGLSRLASAGDLIAYWSFDNVGEGLSVDVQAGNVGVLFNGAQFTNAGTGHTGGASDRSMLFGNDRHRMHVTDASFLNAAGATNSISISFWQNLTLIRNETAFWANSATVSRAFSTHAPWGDSVVYWDTGGGAVDGVNRISANPGAQWLSTWEHVVLVKNGDTKRIYVNGVEVINGLNTAPLPTDFTELFIGNNPTNLTEAVEGSLDDIAIFSRELTPAEVMDIFNGTVPSALDPDNDVDMDTLPDAWELRFAADLTVLSPGNDADNDGLDDEDEFAQGTKPNNTDTDGDGAPDGSETRTGIWVDSTDRGTNPLVADTDGDGVSDGVESNTGTFVDAADSGSNPLVTDTDGDGFSDGTEVIYSTSNPNNPASQPLRPGQLDLLAYWDFNDSSDPGTTLDRVKGFPGTLKAGTAFSSDGTGVTATAGDRAMDMGLVGSAGTGVIVEGGGFLNIAAAQDQIAISLWENLAATPDSSSIYANSTTIERGINAHIPWSNGQVYWDTNGCCDGGTQRINTPGGLALGTWQHIVLNKNGDTKAIWVNGVKIAEGTNTNDLPTTFTRFFMGTDAGILNMAGLIDDVAVYADALTDAEIALLFSGVAPDDPSLVPPNTDTDGDGMQDDYENANGLNPLVDDRFDDLDVDGLNNISEFLAGTMPNNPDSDADTLLDGAETNTGVWTSSSDTGTDPLLVDSDGDSLPDNVETCTGVFTSLTDTGTDPNKRDSDGDRWTDGDEIGWPTDPNDRESVPTADPDRLDLVAYWDFNDASVPTSALDCMHGFEAVFFGADTAFSAAGEGVYGSAEDRALDLGPNGGSNGAHVSDARWFGLGVAPATIIPNLGSIGFEGDMSLGAGVAGASGALVGSGDTAVTNTAPNNSTRVEYTPALNPPGTWSSEVWLKPAAAMTPGQLTCAISNGNFASPRTGWLCYQSDIGWNFRTYYNDGLSTAVNVTATNGAPPEVGVWTHLVFTWDGSVARVYVDGQLSVTSDPRDYVPGVSGGFHVGGRADGAFQWSGDIDEVAFYGTVLSDADVAARYANATDANPGQSYDSLILESNPLGYWRMGVAPQEPEPDQAAVSFWQKLTATSNSSSFWATSPSSNNAQRGFQAHSPWGDGNFYFDTAGCCDDPTQRLTGPLGAVVGEWEHYVYQKIGGLKEVWRNGVLIMSGEGAAPLPNDFTRFTIGSQPSGAGGINAVQGLIDDMAVFADVLTPEEITRLYEGETPKQIAVPPTPLAFTDIVVNDLETEVTLTWNSRQGRLYSLETTEDVTAAMSWIETEDGIDSEGETTTHVVLFPGGAPDRLFFRVKEQ